MKHTRLNDILYNEMTLLWYSLRMLVGRNLLAVGIISVVLLTTVELLRRRSERLRGISPA